MSDEQPATTPQPASRRRRWPIALGVGGAFAIAGLILRLVALVYAVKHPVTPQQLGYHSIGVIEQTTFWIHPSTPGTLDIRATGGLGRGCRYNGPDLSSPTATTVFGPAGYLQVCNSGSLSTSLVAFVVPSVDSTVRVTLSDQSTATELGALDLNASGMSERLIAFTVPASETIAAIKPG